MTDDLPDRFLAARLAPVRQALWDNGEITIAGLARLDRALGIETYAEEREEVGMREKHRYALSELFRAAQECTGLTMPGMWEPTGEMHLNGQCDCAKTPNQCDGCARGLPTDNHGNHIGPGGFWGGDYMACTADRYTGEG